MKAKYISVAEAIRDDVTRLIAEGKSKLPSESALCATYGVSRQTVRQALALLSREGIVATRQGSGTYICTRPGEASRIIAIHVSRINEYTSPASIGAVRDMLAARGYVPEVIETGGSVRGEREALLRLLEAPVAGLLAEGCRTALPNPNDDLYGKLRMLRVPVVMLCAAESTPAVNICANEYDGGYMLTKYLLGKGRKRIAGIFQADDRRGVERYNGFMCALRDAGAELPHTGLLLFTSHERDTLFEPCHAPLIKNAYADAVVCQDDDIACRLIKALNAESIRVPGDVAVVGFDNSYLCELSKPRITSLGHERLPAAAAAECLLDMLAGRKPAPTPLGWHLYERKSSG